MDIIITGAGKGIGFEVVKQLLENKAHRIIAISRNVNQLNQLQQEMDRDNLFIIACDLADDKAFAQCLDIIKSTFSSIDILINNAGSLINKRFENTDFTDLQQVFKTNVFVPFLLTQQLEFLMGKKNTSHVINIGSMGGFQGSAKFVGLSAYSMSKAALANMTECLAEEWKDKNIKINCLALGAVQTEMLSDAFPNYKAPTQPKEMAEFIVAFALSGYRSFNGKVLPVSISTP